MPYFTVNRVKTGYGQAADAAAAGQYTARQQAAQPFRGNFKKKTRSAMDRMGDQMAKVYEVNQKILDGFTAQERELEGNLRLILNDMGARRAKLEQQVMADPNNPQLQQDLEALIQQQYQFGEEAIAQKATLAGKRLAFMEKTKRDYPGFSDMLDLAQGVGRAGGGSAGAGAGGATMLPARYVSPEAMGYSAPNLTGQALAMAAGAVRGMRPTAPVQRQVFNPFGFLNIYGQRQEAPAKEDKSRDWSAQRELDEKKRAKTYARIAAANAAQAASTAADMAANRAAIPSPPVPAMPAGWIDWRQQQTAAGDEYMRNGPPAEVSLPVNRTTQADFDRHNNVGLATYRPAPAEFFTDPNRTAVPRPPAPVVNYRTDKPHPPEPWNTSAPIVGPVGRLVESDEVRFLPPLAPRIPSTAIPSTANAAATPVQIPPQYPGMSSGTADLLSKFSAADAQLSRAQEAAMGGIQGLHQSGLSWLDYMGANPESLALLGYRPRPKAKK